MPSFSLKSVCIVLKNCLLQNWLAHKTIQKKISVLEKQIPCFWASTWCFKNYGCCLLIQYEEGPILKHVKLKFRNSNTLVPALVPNDINMHKNVQSIIANT